MLRRRCFDFSNSESFALFSTYNGFEISVSILLLLQNLPLFTFYCFLKKIIVSQGKSHIVLFKIVPIFMLGNLLLTVLPILEGQPYTQYYVMNYQALTLGAKSRGTTE